MKKYFLAEKMKCRKTSVGKLMILMPIFTLVFSMYISGSYFIINSSNWWYIMMFPAMAALMCGVIVQKDKKLKNHAVLTLPVEQKKVWDGKVLYGLWATGAGLTLMFFLILAGEILGKKFTFVITNTPSAGRIILAWAVLFLTFMWQVPFCMFLAEALGSLPMVLIHVVLYQLVFIALSLKPYYMLLPGAIPARVMCPVLGIMPNNLLAVPGSVGFYPELLNAGSVWVGVAASLIWFLLFWGIGRKWYEKQGVK